MSEAFVDVVPSPWGRTALSFDAAGRLIELKIRTRREAGARGRRPAGAPSHAALARWLKTYGAGREAPFPGDWEVPGASTFRQAVYRVVAAIPTGETLSYGEVAAAAGSPGASRAVGTAMGQNPLPLVIP